MWRGCGEGVEGSIEWIHVIGLLHAARRGGGGIGEEERKTRGG